MHEMNQVLQHLIGKFARLYIDDILIYNKHESTILIICGKF